MAVFSHLIYNGPFQGLCDGYLVDSLMMAPVMCWNMLETC